MCLTIQYLTNEEYNSNTYLIKNKNVENSCYLIDAGQSEKVFDALTKSDKITAIFLTHAHYDHICGINQITARFPECVVYCSELTKKALANSKINLSFYHSKPTVFISNKIIEVSEENKIEIYPQIHVAILATPGHNEGCLSFKIDNALFTGDSLIPGIAIVTKLKSGNKAEAPRSIIKIKDNTSRDDVIYPGHGRSFEASKIDWNFYH
jgi:hydroxyacylglutathione hydrolase